MSAGRAGGSGGRDALVGNLRLWWEFLARCWRAAPALMLVVLGCELVTTVSFAVNGIALRAIVDGTIDDDRIAIAVGAVGAALAYTTTLALGEIMFMLRIHLVERVAITDVESQTLRDTTGIETIEHLERTDYLDRINLIRGEAWAIVDSAWAAVESVLMVVQLALILALLGSVNPVLLGLVVFAAVPLLFEQRGRTRIRDAETAAEQARGLERHLLKLATEAASAKEIMMAGVGSEVVRRQRAACDEATLARYRARMSAAWWSIAGWIIFGVGFVGGLVLVVVGAPAGGSQAGNLVLVVTVGLQLRWAVEAAVTRAADTGGYGRLLTPYRWLRRYAAERRAETGVGLPAPTTLRRGITIEHLTFGYPGTGRPAVDDLSVHLPAGSVVAVVGEYGSGKTTLVKLLAKLYRPDSGRILVDGVDLADLDTTAWRTGMSAAFQDFGRYRTVFAEAVGLGDIDRFDDPEAVAAAIAAADAEGLVARLPAGVGTRLGRQFGGVDLSEGQWQKVALARACMRQRPLLFLLDEPTASLDAPSEHAIFTRYMERARTIGARTRAVTVVVSHRFSTVAGADLILVMAAGRLIEAGDHETLVGADGAYAALYGIQARAYAAR